MKRGYQGVSSLRLAPEASGGMGFAGLALSYIIPVVSGFH